MKKKGLEKKENYRYIITYDFLRCHSKLEVMAENSDMAMKKYREKFPKAVFLSIQQFEV